MKGLKKTPAIKVGVADHVEEEDIPCLEEMQRCERAFYSKPMRNPDWSVSRTPRPRPEDSWELQIHASAKGSMQKKLTKGKL